jgi:hypothetical protein
MGGVERVAAVPVLARVAGLWLIGALLLGGCGYIAGGPEVRYRITVEVDTPDGLRAGSSVWSFQLRPDILTQSYTSKFRGESVAVEIPGGGTLFAVLGHPTKSGTISSDEAQLLPETVLRRTGITSTYENQVLGDRSKTLEFISKLTTEAIALDCGDDVRRECPLLVYFRDPHDPSSVQSVEPDELGKVFGPGVSLRRITLQITRDAVAREIGKRLPWLVKYQRSNLSLDGVRHTVFSTNPPLAVQLGSGHFSTEL